MPFLATVCWTLTFLLLPADAFAVTVASQDQNYSGPLTVFQAIQELGNNLSGAAQSFTFRVSTSRTNLNQFDHTAPNSKIYDKDNNNSYILACVPNSSDTLAGLTFHSAGVPAGYEDVTIDFSCRNYSFIPGHRYLIFITNANRGNSDSGHILFAAAPYANAANDLFTGGGVRYGNGNPYDYSNNSGSCDPVAYSWGSTNPWHNGCYVWGIAQNDLYFVLTNNTPPPPPPRLPVVFIPGIGGSELKASQDIFYANHAYANNEKIWVNQDEAVKLGEDDYFDVLKLKPDGVTPEAALSLTGSLSSFGYGDIDNFFTGMGYVKGTNYFVFPYDWRKDVRSSQGDLDALIESAKTLSGQTKVNLVVHSMGGLIARYYISDSTKAAKVNKLIELGVPHLGTVDSLKNILYGTWFAKDFYFFKLGIPPSETYDLVQNFPAAFQTLPSTEYYNFYDNLDIKHPFPFRDDRDVDNDQVTGSLNFDQTKTLIKNLNHNMAVFDFGEQFHNTADTILNNPNGVKIYGIVGSGKDTLGQIRETWLIQWPINLIAIQDEIKVDGDGNVPTFSASLKNEFRDLSGGAKIYYLKQEHTDMTRTDGPAMLTVKSILNDDNALPTEVKNEKISLDGQQLSVYDADLDLYDNSGNHTGLDSNGEVETKIPDTSYHKSSKSIHVFVDKSATKVTAKIKSSKTIKANIKIRNYSQDSINKTIFYNDVPVNNSSTVQFVIDPNSQNTPTLTSGTQTITASAEATGSAALDQTPPTTSIQISGTKDASGIYTGPVTVTLTGSDSGSGILRTEYSLDNGVTVQTYTAPFTISTPGKTTIQVKSIDKLGNEEIPQTITIEIAAPPTPTPTPTTTSSSSTGTSSSSSDNSTSKATVSTTNTSRVGFDSPEVNSGVLGIEFQNPSHISDQINVSHVLDELKNPEIKKTEKNTAQEILGGLLMISGGIVTVAGLGFSLTFIHPTPK